MCKQNLSRWIVQITACSLQGHHKQALHLFHQFQSLGLQLNPYIIPSILKSCSNLSSLKTGRTLHGRIIRSLIKIDPFVSSALIDLYYKCRKLGTARKVFDTTPQRDLVVWNSLISGYAHFWLPDHALVLFAKLRFCGFEPDLFTWNMLISGFSKTGNDAMALDLLKLMEFEGILPDVFSWTSIITGLVQNFKYEKAFSLFREMVVIARVRPSSVTISGILPACANSINLTKGKEVHGYAVAIGVEKDIFVGSSLVDMYSKCGHIFEAEKVFDKMIVRTSASWNSIIFGYSNHGYCEKAIRLFYRMKVEGVTPDHLTFTAVLTACSHSGMVEFGKSLLNLMQAEYEIEPRLEHYACMVDLLGRAGRIGEAYEFIQAMGIKPDSFVWGALLGACRMHGEIEIAEVAASRLQELEPKSSGGHVLLSNVLMDVGRFSDASEIDKLRRKQKLRKYAGCSWLQDAQI